MKIVIIIFILILSSKIYSKDFFKFKKCSSKSMYLDSDIKKFLKDNSKMRNKLNCKIHPSISNQVLKNLSKINEITKFDSDPTAYCMLNVMNEAFVDNGIDYLKCDKGDLKGTTTGIVPCRDKNYLKVIHQSFNTAAECAGLSEDEKKEYFAIITRESKFMTNITNGNNTSGIAQINQNAMGIIFRSQFSNMIELKGGGYKSKRDGANAKKLETSTFNCYKNMCKEKGKKENCKEYQECKKTKSFRKSTRACKSLPKGTLKNLFGNYKNTKKMSRCERASIKNNPIRSFILGMLIFKSNYRLVRNKFMKALKESKYVNLKNTPEEDLRKIARNINTYVYNAGRGGIDEIISAIAQGKIKLIKGELTYYRFINQFPEILYDHYNVNSITDKDPIKQKTLRENRRVEVSNYVNNIIEDAERIESLNRDLFHIEHNEELSGSFKSCYPIDYMQNI